MRDSDSAFGALIDEDRNGQAAAAGNQNEDENYNFLYEFTTH